MASSTQVIKLINGAISKIGGGDDGTGGVLLTSSADLSNPGDQLVTMIADRFDPVVSEALAETDWAPCLHREALTQEALADPVSEFDYMYQFPADSDKLALRLTRLWLDDFMVAHPGQDNSFEVEGDYILTSAAECAIQYVWYPNVDHSSSNDTTWNNYFSRIRGKAPKLYNFLRINLALELAYQIVGSAAHEERLRRERDNARREAMAANATVRPQSRFASFDLIRARYTRR